VNSPGNAPQDDRCREPLFWRQAMPCGFNGLALVAILACCAAGGYLLWDNCEHPLHSNGMSVLFAAVLLTLGVFLAVLMFVSARRLARRRYATPEADYQKLPAPQDWE
jgi:hypothetical protein